MPLLFGDRVIGWANAAIIGGRLHVDLGFVNGRRPARREFRTALEREIAEMESFLAITAEPDGRVSD